MASLIEILHSLLRYREQEREASRPTVGSQGQATLMFPQMKNPYTKDLESAEIWNRPCLDIKLYQIIINVTKSVTVHGK